MPDEPEVPLPERWDGLDPAQVTAGRVKEMEFMRDFDVAHPIRVQDMDPTGVVVDHLWVDVPKIEQCEAGWWHNNFQRDEQ